MAKKTESVDYVRPKSEKKPEKTFALQPSWIKSKIGKSIIEKEGWIPAKGAKPPNAEK